MKLRIFMIMCAFTLIVGKAQAQFVVTDPINLAQGIINSVKNIVQTSTTASNMINNFQETKKIFDQGKEYYDALKKANNLIKDAAKVRDCIVMVGDISEVYVESFQLMMQDESFTVEELAAMALGYTRLLEESNNLIKELKEVVNLETLSMTDKDRMEVVDKCYYEIRQYRNLVVYYTNKNVSVSYLRAKKIGDTDRVMALYGSPVNRYW